MQLVERGFSLYSAPGESTSGVLDPGLRRLFPFSSLAVFKDHTTHARSACILLIDEAMHLDIVRFDI